MWLSPFHRATESESKKGKRRREGRRGKRKKKGRGRWRKGGRCSRLGFHRREGALCEISARQKRGAWCARGYRPMCRGPARGSRGQKGKMGAFIAKQPAPGWTSERIRLNVGNYLNARAPEFVSLAVHRSFRFLLPPPPNCLRIDANFSFARRRAFLPFLPRREVYSRQFYLTTRAGNWLRTITSDRTAYNRTHHWIKIIEK